MKRTWIGVGVTLAALYLLFALGAYADWFVKLDESSTTFLQNTIPRFLDVPFSILSLLGSFEFTALLLVAVLLACFRPADWVRLLGLFLLIVLVEWIGKQWINQPGPNPALSRYVFHVSMPTAYLPTPFSFPSGHAARSAFLCVIVSLVILKSNVQFPAKATLLALVVAIEAVMLVSRVYLGDHWVTDVLAGTVLGTLMALPAIGAEIGRAWKRSGTGPVGSVRLP